jgi:vacuolar-type H+-ATPase subunit E/Vma4
MPIAELIAALERDAAQQAAEIARQAEAEAEALIGGVRAQIQAEQEEQLAVRAEELQAAAYRELASTRRNARSEWLQTRAATLEQVLARARELLPQLLARPELETRLRRDLGAALTYVPAGATLLCPPELVPVLEPALRQETAVTVQPAAEIGTGFCLRSADGTVEVPCTLEAELRRCTPELSVLIARELEA